MGGAQKELSFPELVAVLHRRRWLLFGGLLLGGLSGVATALAIPPVFVAQSLVLLEPRQAGTGAAGGGGGAMPGAAAIDAGVVDSQARILASRSLAGEVIDRLGLERDPELAAEPGGAGSRLASRLAGVVQPSTTTLPSPAEVPGRRDLVGRFLDRLTVRRDGRSYVIAVAYRSGDGEKAARVANAVAELYRAGQQSQKVGAARRALAQLEEQTGQAQRVLEDAQARFAAFRAGTERDRGDGLGVKDLELAELNRQLVLASAERSAREARLTRLRAEVAAPGGPGMGDAGGSALLQNLGALKAELLRREAELAGRYGERHPKLQDLRLEKAELDGRIAEEQEARVRDLAGEVEAARARERALALGLEGLKGRALRQDEAARGAEALEREVELSRRLYEGLVQRASAMADLAGLHEPDARVISEAVPPVSPSFPKPDLLASLGATAGLALALVLLYLLESRDRGFGGAAEVEAALGLPALALVPELPRAKRGTTVPPQDYVIERPRSRYAEALREVLAGLRLDARARGGAGRVVLLTSVLPDEGKSTLALSLGRLAAAEGLRALVVDVDLRRPCLHRLAGLRPGPGVIELLRGEVAAEEVVHTDPRSDLRILASSGRLSQPTRLLTADRLGRVLELVRFRYDLVVVDAAPLAAVADPRFLAPLVDQVLLLVRHASTRRALCAPALAALRAAAPGVAVAGVVLTRVDPRRARRRATAGAAHPSLAAYYAD